MEQTPNNGTHAQSTRALMAFVVVTLGATLAVSGCRAILGLDEPTLDPCFDGCLDGDVPDVGDDGSSAESAAPPDSAIPDAGAGDAFGAPEATAPHGVQCGPSAQGTFCTPDAPVCCRRNGDASVVYTCVSGVAACSADGDYDIQCSNASTCGAGQICCHYNSAMKCETIKDCTSGGDRVCDPNALADCADGSTCSRQLPSLPYFACTP